ncbi:hypothetical protein PPMP20_22800 [Paraburkholderia phymatum]|uniref:Transmembrane protein n=1 Tax=Paraburkholderia phymatum (strain DSM 17167 / CIP 108236 / LMG 21445 / STM815) TaxID=391038 RepID=B2JP12_PARP8|nr:hypothetical protein [Paraburkholderia phymatum]ACC74565.1 conserved hypothetical protein [Paraburkholderia phymatum STM815]
MSDQPTRTRDANDRDGLHRDLLRFHSWRLLIAALATPLAWFAQMLIGEVLTAQACSRSDAQHPAPVPSWAIPALIVLSMVCFVIGAIGVALAWRTVTFARRKRSQARSERERRVAELEWFLARVSALSSAMFMFGLVATDLAVIVVSPCGRW